jgi:hypothetical protein
MIKIKPFSATKYWKLSRVLEKNRSIKSVYLSKWLPGSTNTKEDFTSYYYLLSSRAPIPNSKLSSGFASF